MLLDTNILIYASKQPRGPLAPFLLNQAHAVSEAAVIEALGYPKLPLNEEAYLSILVRSLRRYPVDALTAKRAVTLRQSHSMSLGDAIIAATALRHNLPLATHNTADFRWIGGLQLVDPLAPTP